MKALKIILGILLSFGLLMGGIPTFFEDMSNGADGAVLFGEAFGIRLFGAVIFYLFSTASNSKKESTFEPEFKEQRECAKQTADKYSKTPYEDFINSALFNIKFVVQKTPTIGGIILVFLVGLMFLIFMGFLFSSNIDGGTGALVGLFILSISGAFFYVAIKDWNKLMDERKRQQSGKHYR